MMDSSKDLIKELRANRIERFREQQDFKRSLAFEKHRILESDLINEQDIHGLCSRTRIKRRKRADEEDLRRLAKAFIQSEENIIAFLKVTGAINVIVKEFTSNDRNQQLLAASTLANLSLGNNVSCSKLSVFIGSYLMIFLVNTNDVLFTHLCVWITQNIAASGGKALDILMSQELVRNCIYLINNSLELQEDAIQLLDVIIDMKWNEINAEEKEMIKHSISSIMKKNFHNLIYLQVFLKTCSEHDENLNETEEISIMMLMNLIESENPEVILCSLRILEQLSQNATSSSFDFLMKNDCKLSNLINKAAENPKYFPTIKHLMKFLSKAPIQYFSFDPVENLKIPKFFEF